MIFKYLAAVCRSVLFVLVGIRSGIKGKARTWEGWETGTAGARKVERVQTITARDRDRDSNSQSDSDSQTKTNNSKTKSQNNSTKKIKTTTPPPKKYGFSGAPRSRKSK